MLLVVCVGCFDPSISPFAFEAFRVLVILLGISLSQDELPGSALPEHTPEKSVTFHLGPREAAPKNRDRLRVRNSTTRRHNLKLLQQRPDIIPDINEKIAESRKKEQKERYDRNCTRIRQVFDQLTNHSCR